MKVVRLVIICLAFTAGLTGCKYSDKYEVADTPQFSMEVPSWMKKQDELRPGAPFQYANRFRNFYAIGEVIKKDSSFDKVVNATVTTMKNFMTNTVVSDSTQITINGLTGSRLEIFGKMGEENIYYSEVILDGKPGYYHLSIWTRGEERKLKYKDDIDKILMSFKAK